MSTDVTVEPLDAGDNVVPDVPGAVLGWRQWRVETQRGRPRLASPVRATQWEPGAPMVAACRAGHAVPTPGCGCGLYAARTVGTAAHAAAGSAAGMVLGRVALWGEIIEGEHGWRATQAYPVLLIVDRSTDDEMVAQLAADYRVEVHRSSVPLSFMRALPGVEHLPLRARGQRRRAELADLVGRHRAVADAVDRAAVGVFLDVTREFYGALRRASLLRIPWEAARATARLYLGPIVWLLLALGFSVTGAPAHRWPAVSTALGGLALLICLPWVAIQMSRGLREVREVMTIRSLPVPVLFPMAVVLFAVAALLQAVLVVGLVNHGRTPPLLPVTLAVVPVGMVVLGLVGWRRCFPPVRP